MLAKVTDTELVVLDAVIGRRDGEQTPALATLFFVGLFASPIALFDRFLGHATWWPTARPCGPPSMPASSNAATQRGPTPFTLVGMHSCLEEWVACFTTCLAAVVPLVGTHSSGTARGLDQVVKVGEVQLRLVSMPGVSIADSLSVPMARRSSSSHHGPRGWLLPCSGPTVVAPVGTPPTTR